MSEGTQDKLQSLIIRACSLVDRYGQDVDRLYAPNYRLFETGLVSVAKHAGRLYVYWNGYSIVVRVDHGRIRSFDTRYLDKTIQTLRAYVLEELACL